MLLQSHSFCFLGTLTFALVRFFCQRLALTHIPATFAESAIGLNVLSVTTSDILGDKCWELLCSPLHTGEGKHHCMLCFSTWLILSQLLLWHILDKKKEMSPILCIGAGRHEAPRTIRDQTSLQCTLSLAAQCIVIGPVCLCVGVFVGLFVCYHDNLKLPTISAPLLHTAPYLMLS